MNYQNNDINTLLYISERGLALIKRYEGFSASVYKDSAGKDTIGFGHLLKSGDTFDAGISKLQAEQLLLQDIALAEQGIHRLLGVSLTQSQYDALVSFVYNVGVAAFARSTLKKALNGAEYRRAGDEFLRWNKIRKNGVLVESPGLTARRSAERILFLEEIERPLA